MWGPGWATGCDWIPRDQKLVSSIPVVWPLKCFNEVYGRISVRTHTGSFHKDNKGCILDFVVIFRSICLAMFRWIFVLVIVAGKLVYSIGRDKELIFRFSRAISQGVTTVATTTTAAAVPNSVAIYIVLHGFKTISCSYDFTIRKQIVQVGYVRSEDIRGEVRMTTGLGFHGFSGWVQLTTYTGWLWNE